MRKSTNTTKRQPLNCARVTKLKSKQIKKQYKRHCFDLVEITTHAIGTLHHPRISLMSINYNHNNASRSTPRDDDNGPGFIRDSEDDLTFQPPALSSYAMSLLNDINNKKSHLNLLTSDDKSSALKLFNFQPRISSIMNSTGLESKRYSSTNEKTATTMDSKRTSVGHHTTTPYTEFLPAGKDEDEMEISPVNHHKAQVHFDVVDQRPSTPLNTQKHRKAPASISRLSFLEPTKNARSQRRFTRLNLGAPKRVSKRETDFEQEEDIKSSLRKNMDEHNLEWLEEEKQRIRAENLERKAKLVRSSHEQLLQDSNRYSDGQENYGYKSAKDLDLQNEKNNKENIRQDHYHSNDHNMHQYGSTPGKRVVLSSISPNIENQIRTPRLEKIKSVPVVQQHQDYRTTPLIRVNDRTYEKLELVGKGGTSKVYKLRLTSNGKMFAIKRVTFDEFDESAILGFKGEIQLLKKLASEERVVKLVDYVMNERSLMLVMECGDIDLAHVLTSRMHLPLDIAFVRYHMIEMLKCVTAVHNAGIVHSDLKPANFIFVKGVLKIIDFGIANALSDHTMNIYRESQIGTPNYMSPESLLEVNTLSPKLEGNTNSTWKVGRLSDVWSCGCIIYQMIYGRPPYASYSGNQRLLAIMNPQVKISYPDTGLGDVKVPKTAIDSIQNCLQRDPHKRWSIEQLLNGSFCRPKNVSKEFIEDLVTNAINFGAKNGDITKGSLNILTNEVWSKIEELNL